MSFNNKPKIVTVVGPTASGKTSLSIALAKNFSGEVISADSRQVYRGLDLGSGKVTKEEMLGIPHHLLDIADPMQVYTASDFTRDGEQAIRDIFIRSHTPIIAGGTFMYLDTLLGKISVPEVPPNPALRTELESLDTNVLIERLRALDPARTETIDPDNPRRLIRAIEIATALGHVPSTIEPVSPYEVLTIGLRLPKEEFKDLLEQGVPHTRLEDLGLEYRYISRYLQCALSYEDMVSTLETKIRQFAKRQMTWLKRDKLIKWFHPTEQEAIFSTVTNFLQD
jgi:tRNA dimethylallyltransferase